MYVRTLPSSLIFLKFSSVYEDLKCEWVSVLLLVPNDFARISSQIDLSNDRHQIDELNPVMLHFNSPICVSFFMAISFSPSVCLSFLFLILYLFVKKNKKTWEEFVKSPSIMESFLWKSRKIFKWKRSDFFWTDIEIYFFFNLFSS